MPFPIRTVFMAALLLAACGGDGGGDGTGSTTTPPPSGGTTDGNGDGTQETTVTVNCDEVTANVTVNIVARSFQPREVGIAVNGIVRFINADDETHTVTSGEPNHSDAGALFDSGNLAPGASFCVQLSNNVEVDYFCTIHPEMQGEIEVGTARNDDDDDDNNGDDANRGGGNDDPDNPSGDDDSDDGNDANRGRG